MGLHALHCSGNDACNLRRPCVNRSTNRALRRSLVLASAFACAGIGCWLVYVFGSHAGWAATGLGFCLASLPVPIYIALVLWIDRFEAEPPRLLAWAFFLGATLAAASSAIANTVVDEMFAEDPSMQWLVLSSGAVVEEVTKGLILLGLWVRKPDEFDGIIDGIVYAGMVGLGFAMTENIQYYGFASSRGLPDSLQLFVLRGCLAPYAHPLFAGITGVALGFAVNRRGLGWALGILGIALASFVHAVWNIAAAEGQFMSIYTYVMVPVFVAGLGLVAFAIRREGQIVAKHLAVEVERGRLTQAEYLSLTHVSGRLRAGWQAFRSEGLRGWQATRRRQQAAGELAFLRARRGRMGASEFDSDLERQYLEQIAAGPTD